MKYVVSIIMLLLFSSIVWAQVPDTVAVAPGLNTLADALEDAANFGKVFKLQRGGVYVNERLAYSMDSVASTCYIYGEKEPADQPPAMIQRYIGPGDATWEVLVASDYPANVKFENVGFYCYSQNGEPFLGAVDIWKSGGSLELNNCFFDGSNWAAIFVEANNVDIKITNNLFLNSTNSAFFQQGHLYEGWGVVGTTAEVYNNTMVNFGGEGQGDGVKLDTLKMLHNTWLLVDRHVSWDGWMGQINRIFENNIMVDCYARGYVGPRPDWKEHPDSAGYAGDNGDQGKTPSPLDSLEGVILVDSLWRVLGDSTFLGSAEAERLVSIRNNLKYTTQLLKDHQASITATNNPLFNNWTLKMFNDFPNKINEGNLDETVDPDFVQGLPASVYEPFFKNNYQRRNLGAREEGYPFMENWDWSGQGNFALVPTTWPVPLNLKPQAPELETAGTDGYPLGDLNWWGEKVVEDWENGRDYTDIADEHEVHPIDFVLSQNYPNPFNPVTHIVYQLSRKAQVSLDVYNIVGQKVRTLVNNDKMAAGVQEVTWDGKNDFGKKLGSGIYFYKLAVDNKVVDVKKMMMIK